MAPTFDLTYCVDNPILFQTAELAVLLQDVPTDGVRSQCGSAVPATSSAPLLDGLYRPSGNGFSSPATGLHLHDVTQTHKASGTTNQAIAKLHRSCSEAAAQIMFLWLQPCMTPRLVTLDHISMA